MNEKAARELVLAWAIESSDAEYRVVTASQRTQLDTRVWAHAQAHARGDHPSEVFLARRAELLLHEAADSTPAFSAVLSRRKGLGMLAAGLPVLAFLVGLLFDRITNPHRVDLLSIPLLVIVFWNLLVYARLLVAAALPKRQGRPVNHVHWLTRWAVRHAWSPRSLPAPWPAAIHLFVTRWTQLASPLFYQRALRLVHCCAAALALGAIGSLYLRGLWVQYQAGWESTFLQSEQVYGLLLVLFNPAMWVFGLQGFSLADVQALQWPQAASAAPAGGGARWAHLYAASLVLWVVLPRCGLALVAYVKERRLAGRFRPDPSHPYVHSLLRAVGAGSTDAGAGVLRVFPYSFTVDEPRSAGLQDLALKLLGAQARVVLEASTAYGEELHPATGRPHAGSGLVREVALFNLSATPEAENHGAFLDSLVQQGHTALEIWVDVSAYQQRMGAQGGGAERLAQRSALWQDLGHSRDLPVRTVHLLQPEALAHGQSAATAAPVLLA